MLNVFKQQIIGFVALLFCFVQTGACVLQAYHGHSLFNLCGTTSGRVELAMCIAMCIPLILFEFINPKTGSNKKIVGHIYRILILPCFLLSVALLILSESRTSWLASIVGCCYVVYVKLTKRDITIKPWQKFVIITFFCIGSIGLYYLRPNSANGRILIWKVATKEIIHGNITLVPRQGNFSTFIGEAQEGYFSKVERSTEEKMLAGAPNYAYNEFLQIFVEWGLVATIVLLCSVIYVCVKLYLSRTLYKTPLVGSLISLAIISFFSYPLRCTTSLFVILIIITISVVLLIKRPCVRKCLLFVLIPFLSCCFIWRYRHDFITQKAIAQCRQIDLVCTYDNSAKYLPCYQRLRHILEKNPEYMLAYAKALYDSEKYELAIRWLHKAQLVSGDPVLHLVEGKCRQKERQIIKAEKLYKKAYYRIPHKIYPLYLLMNLYLEQQNFYQAKEIAEKIIRTKPKIKSVEFYFIQNEAKIMLNTNRSLGRK